MEMCDTRYRLIKERFSRLSKEEIQNIVDNIDLVCLDTHNYDAGNKKYCPLAVAMNLHNTVSDPTDEKIKNEISKRFNPVNILKGVEGDFYRNDRKDDLLKICNELLCTE
jgi:hypothetical protein